MAIVTCPVCARPLITDPNILYCPFCGALLSDPTAAPLWVLDRDSGLFNYRFMEAMLNQEYARSQRYDRPLAFLLMQLKKMSLKQTQAILQDVRAALGHGLRDADTLGRWGPESDRFAVILPETTPSGAAIILARMQAIPLIASHSHCGLACVIGAVSSPLDLAALAQADLSARSR